MLIVVRVEVTTMEIMNAVLAKKEITITGQAVSLYPEDDYIKELEEKARKYDELMDLGERIAESMSSSTGEKEAKEKSIEILKDFSKLGFLGHDINRVSRLSERSKMNIKQDIRKIRNKHNERLIAILQKQAAFNDEELREADSIIEEFLSDKKILKEWIKSCHILNSKIKEELPNLRVYKLEYLSMIIHNIKASKIRILKPFRES